MDEERAKACPKCGALLFEDMDVCYECLYEFGDEKVAVPDAAVPDEAAPDDGIPDTTVLDTCASDMVVPDTYAAERPAERMLHMVTDAVDADIPVPDGGLIIGRSPTCDVVLHAKSISRQHVHVEPDVDGVSVCDLGARNTPKLNGRPLKGEAHMMVGDVLSLCGVTFELIST